jgi:hypothetical protein
VPTTSWDMATIFQMGPTIVQGFVKAQGSGFGMSCVLVCYDSLGLDPLYPSFYMPRVRVYKEVLSQL